VLIADVARVVLGAVFAVSAATKLGTWARWRSDAAALGVPSAVAIPVPPVEAVLAGLLVSGLATPWPAVAGAVLLLAFTGLLAVRLVQGVRPPCACFGAWSSRPLGPGHLARNAGLLVLALLAVWS